MCIVGNICKVWAHHPRAKMEKNNIIALIYLFSSTLNDIKYQSLFPTAHTAHVVIFRFGFNICLHYYFHIFLLIWDAQYYLHSFRNSKYWTKKLNVIYNMAVILAKYTKVPHCFTSISLHGCINTKKT